MALPGKELLELGLYTDFKDRLHFRPAPHQEEALTQMLDQLLAWSEALRPLRA
ncbi:hypothetical protein [Phytoactinopolyspora endophytica]|uniref:hypothetical protein n=1 Tax=Phytoactinopolyspora endophytica TaxID=1642495 RepID=UPI0013EA7330|nr:hypothetical protein [Phytoactinopolyspora endophytica]